MRDISHGILAFICLAIAYFMLVGCDGDDGWTPPPPPPPDNNAIHIIVFDQPGVYTDNTKMGTTPDKEIAGYEIYMGRIATGGTDNMVVVAYINNPLVWDPAQDKWVGRWNIWDNNNLPEVKNARPDGTTSFSLKAISTKIDATTNQPFESKLSVPWIYFDPPSALDNNTPREGSPYEEISNSGPVRLDFVTDGDSK
jgi:hypothetical protein